MPRISNRLFLWLSGGIGVTIFALIIYRAAHMAVTFDESGTFDVLAGSYGDVLFAKRFFHSANNHILNSLLLKLSAAIFGTSELALRLPNVLSYVFYFFGSFIISRESSANNLVRLMGVVLFNTLLYVLDFFSLARGYGMATGLELFSLAMLFLYFKKRQERYLFLTFLFASLSVYANFTWLNFFVPLWAAYYLLVYSPEKNLGVFFTQSLKKNLIPLLFAFLLFLFSYIPIRYLRMQDEFRWGSNSWFDSLHIAAKDLLYDNNFINAVVIQIVLILMVLVACLILFRSIKENKKIIVDKRNLFLITSLILMIVMATIIQRNVLNMMYMDGRKAIMYFPLIVCLVILLLNELAERKPVLAGIFSILMIGLSVFNFSYRVHINSVREWWFDENSKELTYYISTHPIDDKRNVAVTWYFSASIRYYNEFKLDTCIEHLVKLSDRTDVTNFAYYYVLGDDIREVPPLYKPLFRFGWDRILLVKDSMNYKMQKQSLIKENESLEKMDETRKNNMLDSMLLSQRRNIDWTKIPVSSGDILKL